MLDPKYPDLGRFSKATGIPMDNLVQAFEIEKLFHEQIMNESDFGKRQELYRDVYTAVHRIYGTDKTDIQQGKNPKDNIVKLFRKELEGKSILEVGCGDGYFLASVSNQLTHKGLVGLDVSIPPLSKQHKNIEFISSDIIKFDISKKFDVVFSDNVFEHIAPSDLNMHLDSIKSALGHGGILIIMMPNRLFGPSDVTRIIDFSYSGRQQALGTHLNESTYGELMSLLKYKGFEDFKTVLPLPKLKFKLPNFRMRPTILQRIEAVPLIVKLLTHVKFPDRCTASFDITLICRKS